MSNIFVCSDDNLSLFFCGQLPITLVSLGLAAAGLGLFMVIFLLMQVCNFTIKKRKKKEKMLLIKKMVCGAVASFCER